MVLLYINIVLGFCARKRHYVNFFLISFWKKKSMPYFLVDGLGLGYMNWTDIVEFFQYESCNAVRVGPLIYLRHSWTWSLQVWLCVRLSCEGRVILPLVLASYLMWTPGALCLLWPRLSLLNTVWVLDPRLLMCDELKTVHCLLLYCWNECIALL